jgi:DNA adenine methylase
MTNASVDPRQHPLPFLKWAGGKRALLPLLRPLVPPMLGTYHEPFVGGGALFFDQRPARAVLSDRNAELVATYVALRDDVQRVVDELRKHEAEHSEAHFLAVRTQRGNCLEPAARAARLIYLNHTCFNGLYRVNRRGDFNVPFGHYKNPRICDEANLRACSSALQTATIELDGFEAVLDRAEPGDFVYFDPPYVPVSKTSSFTSYTSDRFGPWEHRRLRDVTLELAARDVRVVLSNSNAPAVFDLYVDGFQVTRVQAPRSVAARARDRGNVEEVLIVGPSKATARQCLLQLRNPVPEPDPTAGPSPLVPEPETPADFFPTLIGPLPEPVSDEALEARIVDCPIFRQLARTLREGHVYYRLSVQGYWGAEGIPYQLYIDAGRGRSCVADDGAGDITTSLRNYCWQIATAAGVEFLEPSVPWPACRPAVDRVQRIVESLLATDIDRLKKEAEPLWVQARAAYATRTAQVPSW